MSPYFARRRSCHGLRAPLSSLRLSLVGLQPTLPDFVWPHAAREARGAAACENGPQRQAKPTVIASRAPHLLLEQSVMIRRIVDVHRPSTFLALLCLTLSDPPFEANRFKIPGGCARRTSSTCKQVEPGVVRRAHPPTILNPPRNIERV